MIISLFDDKIRPNDDIVIRFKKIDDNSMIKLHKIDVIAQVQISNLYIEKTCKVGSYFFGNGTTYEDEVKKDHKQTETRMTTN